MWNSRGGWKKGGWWWLLNCFFLPFSNHEHYSIKNIYVYSKSKIKTKETNTQNLEYFKMINRRLFVHKFCNNSKMLLSPCLWNACVLRLSICFSFLLIFRFILIYCTRVRTEKQVYYHKDWEVSIMLHYLF